ncbi:MAG: hypothetical protein J6V65_04125, partial [Fibrobacterales bacterium]|nr:hypothetical protein [Fibrobacterales bacterium]
MAGCTAPRCGGEKKCGTGRPFSFDSRCTLRMPVPGLKEPVNFFVIGDTHFGFHDSRDDAYADNYKLRFAIDFEAERTKEMIEPPYGWTTDSSLSRNSIVRPEEADDLPLTPGKNVYIVRDVNASTPALAWTIEVPERPAARSIELPGNDLQYVFLYEDREWDPEPICSREGAEELDGICGVPEAEIEIPGGYWPGGNGYSPILLDSAHPVLRYRDPAVEETAFRSTVDSVTFKADKPVFAPYAELSGQYARLNAAKNFSGSFAKAMVAFVTEDSDEDVVGPYPQTRHDAGLLAPGRHRATFALYLPRADAVFSEEEESMPPPAQPANGDDPGEPILEEEEEEGPSDVERLREATPPNYVLVAIDSAEIDVPDLGKAVWVADTTLSSWAMVGLGGDVDELNGTGLEGKDVLGWSEDDSWDEQWAKYRALDRVFAGEGAWIWVEDTVRFERPAANPESAVELRLRGRDNGWNLFANPYPFGVAANVSPEGEPLYVWDRESGDYAESPADSVLGPYQAFWVHATQNDHVVLPSEPAFASDVRRTAAPAPKDLMRVALRAGEHKGKEILAFLHFPPAWNGEVCREITDLLAAYGVRRCFCGHIH